jgi:hypothetical protein
MFQYNRLSDLRPELLYFGLPKERFVSIKALHETELLILEALEVVIRRVDKTAIKFVFTADITRDTTEADIEKLAHYTITRSAVVRDRLARDRELIPFAATFNVGKYISYR